MEWATKTDVWASGWILNSTSGQLGYTVPFTLDVLENTENELKIEKIQKLSTTQKKQTTQNTANQKYLGSVAFYDTRPGNEVGLFYTEAHMGQIRHMFDH